MKVYVDGVFDLFHFGHTLFLERARALGDYLLVGTNDDEILARYKRRPILNQKERLASIAACRHVDEVVGNAPLVIDHEWIRRHRIDVVAHGDDFSPEDEDRFFAVPKALGIFRVIPYTTAISTSEIIRRVLSSRS